MVYKGEKQYHIQNMHKRYDIKDDEIILDGNVYDLKGFSNVHAGGKQALNIFGGSDTTVHYYMLHPHITLRKNVLKPYRLRKATITDNRYILNSCQFQELKKQINDVIKYPYATLEWYIKAIVIIIIEISLECHSIWFGFTLMKSTCIGIFMALIGLCIQHDANHGAISPNCSINMLWGLTQDWIGGSSLLWKHHHVLHQPKRKMRQNYINNYVSFFSISVNDNIKVANYNLTAQERFVVFVVFDLFYSLQVFHYFLNSIQISSEYFYNR
jgi:hypothetical protein